MEREFERDNSVRLLVALANTVLGLALLVALVWAGLRISHALLIFSLGILVAYALEPLVARLRTLTGGRLSQSAGVLLVLIAFVLLITLLVYATVGPTGRQIRELAVGAPALHARADALVVSTDRWLTRHHVPLHVAGSAERLLQMARDRSQLLAGEALQGAGWIAAGSVDFVLVLLVAIYFLVYSRELRERLSQHVPSLYQRHFQGLRRDMNQILGGFIRGQLLMAAAMGLAAGIGCALLRLPFAILVGLFVAVVSLIPVVGTYLGAAPAVLLALLDPAHPLAKVIWVIGLFVVINEAGSKILYPRLIGSATGLHEVLVLFVLIAGAEVGGIVGAMMAVPLTALVGLVAVCAYRVWQQGQLPPLQTSVFPVMETTQDRPAAAERRRVTPSVPTE